MQGKRKWFFSIASSLICLLLGAALPPPVEAHGKHRPRATRVDQVRRHGDAKMTKRVAGHVTKEAIIRYDLENLVSDADIERTKDEMYTFLKWKLGGPGAIAGQYISSGYDHFEKAYTDEAAAMLLGVISFAGKEPELVMPKWMQSYLKAKAGESGPAVSQYLQTQGVPALVADQLGKKVAEVLTKGVERNVATFIPKEYDVDNRLVRGAIQARKDAKAMPKNPAGLVARKEEEEED